MEILTVSASDYAESVGRSLRRYDMRGAHLSGVAEDRTTLGRLFENKVKIMYPEAECVVDFRSNICVSGSSTFPAVYMASGTALIPRKAESEEPYGGTGN